MGYHAYSLRNPLTQQHLAVDFRGTMSRSVGQIAAAAGATLADLEARLYTSEDQALLGVWRRVAAAGQARSFLSMRAAPINSMMKVTMNSVIVTQMIASPSQAQDAAEYRQLYPPSSQAGTQMGVGLTRSMLMRVEALFHKCAQKTLLIHQLTL